MFYGRGTPVEGTSAPRCQGERERARAGQCGVEECPGPTDPGLRGGDRGGALRVLPGRVSRVQGLLESRDTNIPRVLL